jgi:hypothetical protein
MKDVSAHKPAIALAMLIAMVVLCGGCSESQPLPQPDNSPLTDLEKQARFFAVARTGDFVVAANTNGFFRARVSTKKWERVPHPQKMPSYGHFTISLSDSNSIFFCAGGEGGFYVSKDSGATWSLVSKKFNFQYVFQNKDGRIYAIVQKVFTPSANESAPITTTDKSGNKQHIRWRVVVSSNEGRTWRDISANIGAGMMLLSIFSDPDAPNRVCLNGNGIRGYVLQATDDKYTKWEATREWDWRKDKRTDDDFLQGGYFTTTTAYILWANLKNYFDYDFGSSSEIPAFAIDIDTNHLEFAAGQTVRVPITIKFRPDYAPVRLVDATNNAEFWRIRCICPDGKRVEAFGRSNQYQQINDSVKLKRRIGDGTGFRVVELSSTNSYSRTVDLDKLTDFSKPGPYRICLSYDSVGWGWEGKKHSGIWGGGFSSPIFNLTIKP